jgi:hypothetical protein
MGYDSWGDGRLTLSRPLVWSEYGGSKFAVYSPEGQTNLFLREERGRVTHIEWRDADESKKYDVLSELTELAALLRLFDVTVTGWLVRSGENIGDVERYTIVDGVVVSEKAVLRWPDGSTV